MDREMKRGRGQKGLRAPSYFAPDMLAELRFLYWWWRLLPHSSEMSPLALIFLTLDIPTHDALIVTSSLPP